MLDDAYAAFGIAPPPRNYVPPADSTPADSPPEEPIPSNGKKKVIKK
jgi:hypothetical protein